jgi:hypothetical protein
VSNALKKGQAKLRKTVVSPKTSPDPPPSAPHHESNDPNGMRRVGSRESMVHRKEEHGRELSAKIISSIKEACVERDKVLQPDEIIMASNATIFGQGR